MALHFTAAVLRVVMVTIFNNHSLHTAGSAGRGTEYKAFLVHSTATPAITTVSWKKEKDCHAIEYCGAFVEL